MKCKLFGKTAVLMMMLTLCLLFAPAASAAETTGSSGSHTYYNDSFKLPADVTNIEEEAFYGCAGMTAWNSASRPSLTEPKAESPSTM